MSRIYGYTRGIHSYGRARQKDLMTQTLAVRRYSRALRKFHPRLPEPEIYSDVGIPRAGQNIRSLPAGRQLLVKIKPGDHLIIGHIGRVFPTLRDCFWNLRRWKERGIHVHFAQKDLRMNLKTPGGQLVMKILEAFVDGDVVMRQEAAIAKKRGHTAIRRRLR